jgi:hypothetical protein
MERRKKVFRRHVFFFILLPYSVLFNFHHEKKRVSRNLNEVDSQNLETMDIPLFIFPRIGYRLPKEKRVFKLSNIYNFYKYDPGCAGVAVGYPLDTVKVP